MFNKKENNFKVPIGDKGISGERDDMLKPQVTGRSAAYEHLQRYRYAAKKSQGRILDLGCGTGYGSKILLEKESEVYGIDNSQEAIDYAEKNYPGPKYICCSVEKLPFEDNFFDAICAFEIIEHVQNSEKALEEVCRVLKKNGELFISTPNPRNLKNALKHVLLGKPYPKKKDMNNIYHIKEFYYDEFLNFLKKRGFKILSQYGQNLPIFPRLIANLPFFLKIPILLGYFFPKYAGTIVIHAKK